jgi:3-hydroxyisobutyrate dehydrogenase-like beta-hydroxyacid dehydrogenase
MKTLLSRLSTGVDPANFRLVLMTKDLAYGLKEAERRGVAVPMVSTAHSLFTQAVKSGLGEKDFAAVAGRLETHG